MRLFISINFDGKTKEQLTRVQDRLRKYGTGRFQDPELFHMTLVFMGEYPDELAPIIKKVLRTINISKTKIKIAQIGDFSRGSKVWWAGIERNDRIYALQKEITAKLDAADLWYEKGPFTPHITLARGMNIRGQNIDMKALLPEPFTCTVDSFNLMWSHTEKGRLVYTEKERFALR